MGNTRNDYSGCVHNIPWPFHFMRSLVDLVNLAKGACDSFSDTFSPQFARLGPGASDLLRTTEQSFSGIAQFITTAHKRWQNNIDEVHTF